MSMLTSMSNATRFGAYRAISSALASLSDRQLAARVDDAPVVGSIGGTTGLLDVVGTPVFAKRVPLTELERRADHVMSTANLFELPTCYQYGAGSTGFGVWREVAAHLMTTAWVLGERCESFPLLYHWRVVPTPPRAQTADALAAAADMVAYWHGSPAVRDRLDAIARCSASVVLFLEYIPSTLHAWLTAQLALGETAGAAACAIVEPALAALVSFLGANDLLHFDAHFRNILTDGQRLYLADFGLASSQGFALSATERAFAARHASYDRYVTLTELVNCLVSALTTEAAPAARDAFIRRCAAGAGAVNVATAAAAIIERHAPVAAVMNEFFSKLRGTSRATEYPAVELADLDRSDR
jgi:hypothetical protein